MLFGLHTDVSGGALGGMVFPSLEEFSTVCCDHTVKDFSKDNEAEVDVFLEFSWFFYDRIECKKFSEGYKVESHIILIKVMKMKK